MIWHALAVVIVEFRVQIDGPTVERALAVVLTAFREAAQCLADSEGGRLRRPIEKLMNKVPVVGMKYLEDVAANPGAMPTVHGLPLDDSMFPRQMIQPGDLKTIEIDTKTE